MRTFTVCTVIVFGCSLFSFGQKYQTSFYGENRFKNSVKIPNEVLETLKQDEEMQRCADSNNKIEISADWFNATNVNLNDDKFPDLLVQTEKGCLNGNAFSFWLFTKKQNKYNVVLYTYTMTLEINRKHSGKYHQVTEYRSTASETNIITYAFNGKKYVKIRNSWKPL